MAPSRHLYIYVSKQVSISDLEMYGTQQAPHDILLVYSDLELYGTQQAPSRHLYIRRKYYASLIWNCMAPSRHPAGTSIYEKKLSIYDLELYGTQQAPSRHLYIRRKY